MSASSPTTDNKATAPAEETPQTESPPQPIIPGAVEFKYYRAPDGFKRLRTKRKVAILFGYVGERYCGLQWNHLPDYPTVEEAILKALFETDMISLTNFSQFKVQQLLNFERASRTDRGVHALRNLLSVAIMLPYDPVYVQTYQGQMRLLQAKKEAARDENTVDTASSTKPEDSEKTPEEGVSAASMGIPPAEFSCEEAKKLLNEALPNDIHVYRVEPVTRSFNAYMCCGGRRYEYYIPTFAFMSKEAYTTEYFPPSLAPSMPSLKDTGFVPRSSRPQFFKGPAQGATSDDVPSAKKAGGGAKKNKPSLDGAVDDNEPVSFRKSRGHFPKTKKRRLEEKARREAAEARAQAATPSASPSDAPATTAKETSGSPCDVNDASSTMDTTPSGPLGERSASDNDEDSDEDNNENENDDVTEELDEHGKPRPVDWSKHFATHFNDNIFESMMTFRSIPEEAMRHAASYRLPAAQLDHVRELFHQYEGTHCFHNFTPGGSSRDASCHRYIPSITVSEPMVWSPSDPLVQASIDAWSPSRFFTADDRVAEGFSARLMAVEGDTATPRTPGALNPADFTAEEVAHLRQEMEAHMQRVYGGGLEVVRIELQGQSFMLNQIRKMIGAVVCMCACGLPVSYVQDHLLHKHVRCGIPMAPANGLFLSTLDFSGYNARLRRIQQDGGNGGNKDGIDMDALIDSEELEQARRRITAVVLRNEMVEDLLGKWMRSLRHVVRLAWQQDLL